MKNLKVLTICLILGLAIGCKGPAGPSGPPGPPGVSCYSVEVGETSLDNTTLKQLQVNCPDGQKALGAGWSALDSTDAILDGRATYFEPAFDGSHWLVNAVNVAASTGTEEWKLRMRVICACVEADEE